MSSMSDDLSTQLAAIRKQTRLALPEDETYLYRLGVALYGFSSITSFMIEIIGRLDSSQDWFALNRLEAGRVCERFEEALRKAAVDGSYVETAGNEALGLIRALNSERSDFVHAYPITNSARAQILHRRPKEGESFEVSNAFLDQFIAKLHGASGKLYEVRATLDQAEASRAAAASV